MDDFEQIREDLTAIGDALAAHQAALHRIAQAHASGLTWQQCAAIAQDALSAPAMQPAQATA